MFGSILFSDEGRFKALKDLVDADIKDRKTWYDRARLNSTIRFKRKNTEKPCYENAPNLVDPIINDMIREAKQSIVTTLWQAPRLAQFIGLDQAGVENAEAAEAAFDFHLRRIGKTRSRIAQCVDDELTYGFGLAKLIEVNGRGGIDIPQFCRVSPLNVVVPTATLEVGNADRICHIMRFTVSGFHKAAVKGGWKSTAVDAAEKAARKRSGNDVDRGEARAPYRDGCLQDSNLEVEVWEIFYETADAGRRVCVICPDAPDVALSDAPWTYVKLIGKEDDVPERPWPFVQFRCEDKAGYYNTSGFPEILEVDQTEASAYRTARGISLDFSGKPYLKGQGSSGRPFRFRAGENLGALEIVWAKPPLSEHVYQQDYARNLAMKRVGSQQGAIASVAGADQRKTATEVNAMMSAANGMSVDAVDRFAEPWGEMFGMMWAFMARTAIRNGGNCGMLSSGGKVLPMAAWTPEYCISCGVSGRSVNQIRTLTSLTNLGQLAPVLENMTETLGKQAVKDFYLWIFNTIDTELARKVMANCGKEGVCA